VEVVEQELTQRTRQELQEMVAATQPEQPAAVEHR
jgi:hypothetical protein